MQKKLFIQGIVFFSAMTIFQLMYALCPVCAAMTGVCIGLSRKLGVDDSIIGVWIGGLIASLIAWTTYFLSKRSIRFMGRKPLIVLVYGLLFLGPLYFYKYIGISGNTLWGYDKLLLGIVSGITMFTLGALWYNYLKVHNKGRAYFPFQKVLMPVGLLVVMSIFFYCITR